MSLILDALNRSQTERGSEGDVPGLETRHWVEPLPYAGRWQRGLPWLALGLALLVIAWLLFSGNGESEKAPGEVSAPINRQAPVEASSNLMPNKIAAPQLSMVASPEKETAASPQTAAPIAAESLVADKRETVHGSTANNAAVANLYNATEGGEPSVAVAPEASAGSQAKQQAIEQAVARSRENEQAIDIEQIIKQARQEAENAELSEHPAPFLSQLSQLTKDQIPTIYYTQHDYSSTASQSSVTLNGELVHVGGSVAGNTKLLEILPNSIVLNYRGTEFRLRALNSWINL